MRDVPDRVVPFRAGGFAPRSVPAVGAGTLIGLILLWQGAASAGWIGSLFLPPPLAIAGALGQLAQSGELWRHMSASLERLAIGWAAGTGAGLVLGVAIGIFTIARSPGMAVVSALFPIPKIALVPLFILWFGIGEAPKIALVALGTAFPLYLNLFAGIRGVEPRLIEMARVFGLNWRGLIRHVVLPGALPSALVGLRYSLGVAWLSLVVAEQVNAQAGIGYLINDARDFLRTDIILVGLGLYAMLGLGADALVRGLERRALAWRPLAVRA